jgi:pyruvate, water dikinase
MPNASLVIPLADLDNDDLSRVGGKNASLGEMIGALGAKGVRVPGGFATTADAYRQFIAENELEARIREQVDAYRDGDLSLRDAGKTIRGLILDGTLPADLAEAIRGAYRDLAEQRGVESPDVAVRSSATAEDLPEASFAGQLETFLNIRGEDALLDAVRRCYASLFTDRAIAYREDHGFDQLDVALSVGVQQMVRSDLGAAGVMFSLDTDTGFPHTVLINGAWGLGETVVQGSVDPDEFLVFKPLLDDDQLTPIIARDIGGKAQKLVYADADAEDADDGPTRRVDTTDEERQTPVLNDAEVLALARWAVLIERHYDKPMDMEWAKDGKTGELFIVQARPETVHSQRAADTLKTFHLNSAGDELARGYAIGDAIGAGRVRRLDSAEESERFEQGDVLVTGMTDPDWVPIMRRAAAIVTDHGGRTSHAAIVSRELGLPAVVGTGDGTERLTDGAEVTVSCAQGEIGYVYDGIADYEAEDIDLGDIPDTRTQIMLNLANPAAAMRWWRLPSDGVGLARMEFIINQHIKIHPLALLHPDQVDDDARAQIDALTNGYDDKAQYFVDRLARGIARIAAAHADPANPHPVIVRMSDFKTNEYANLIGGRAFEPAEANPMLGWRGASRYYSDEYREGFALECRAIRQARLDIGLDNIVVMIPFCRTLEEADQVLAVMAEHGLERGANGLQVYVMCEIPSNVILAAEFASRFDGFSIGSNDLTQLVLGVDRDSDRLAHLFDERNDAVKQMIASVIETAHKKERKVGLCGQAPSDHPDFAAFLVRAGIDSISVNPDSFLTVKQSVAEAERSG